MRGYSLQFEGLKSGFRLIAWFHGLYSDNHSDVVLSKTLAKSEYFEGSSTFGLVFILSD